MRNHFGPRQVCFVLWLQAALSIVFGLWGILDGPKILRVFGISIAGVNLEFSLRLDALSAVVFIMVSFLGLIISQYSIRYLDGEAQQGDFFRNLLQTILAVVVLVLSNNLVMFFAAWLYISWGLHKLLLFYGHRRRALYAARKKLLVSRVGDLCLLIAIILIYKTTHTFDFEQLFAKTHAIMASGSIVDQWLLSWATILIAAGAMTKSAQFPFHFWLPETMDTPTPVSALMHAGIINAGGFLVLRMSPLLQISVWENILLTIAGGVTAVYGSLIMTTQNDIKKKLAYSTISQMGLMMFACGVGAPGFALFHIIAHSFYKAYAFLSTGFIVKESKRLSLPIPPMNNLAMIFWMLAGVAVIFIGLKWQDGLHFGAFTYLGIMVLGLSQSNPLIPYHLTQGISSVISQQQRLILGIKFIAVMVLAMLVYFSLELGLSYFIQSTMGDTFTSENSPKGAMIWLNFAIYLLFGCGYWLNNYLIKGQSHLARHAYMYLWNGGYLGTITDKFLNRYWRA